MPALAMWPTTESRGPSHGWGDDEAACLRMLADWQIYCLGSTRFCSSGPRPVLILQETRRTQYLGEGSMWCGEVEDWV